MWAQISSNLPYLLVVLAPSALLVVRRKRRRRLSSEYRAYISSGAWQTVRRRALTRAGWRCEHVGLTGRCRVRSGLQVHHLHYRHFGREWDGIKTSGESLRVLCRSHHVRADRVRRRRSLR